ncbi:hypothetical protein N7472_000259 [Penicillium cf. griseofulvum]|uniref:Uncharacterized protein n=1 Tax=Penicillium cf. griseofulvum TaxID=2972120 RepID=A0A9W9MZB3_9EURO|nr:hypothetical protein N7472_000259 [Penicillium cf. griseofulvum]
MRERDGWFRMRSPTRSSDDWPSCEKEAARGRVRQRDLNPAPYPSHEIMVRFSCLIGCSRLPKNEVIPSDALFFQPSRLAVARDTYLSVPASKARASCQISPGCLASAGYLEI